MLIIWVQSGQIIAFFNKSDDGCDSIGLVYVIIEMSRKESSEESFFYRNKVNDSGTVHKGIKIAFNKNIWRYDVLGDLNIFMDGQSPGIEL